MNNKELLEKIKNQFNKGRTTIGSGACFVSDEHVEWLIQQAERVQELEEVLLQNKYDKALYEKKVIEWLELKEENRRYKRALEFYADEENYKENLISKAEYDADGVCISIDEYDPPIIYFDNGEKARQALEGDK